MNFYEISMEVTGDLDKERKTRLAADVLELQLVRMKRMLKRMGSLATAAQAEIVLIREDSFN